MAQIALKLAVTVGDNGNYAATKYDGDNTDWAFLSDSVGVYDEKKKEVIYQNCESRYVVTAFVEGPKIEIIGATLVESAEN